MIKRQKKTTEAEPLLLSFNHIPFSLNYKKFFLPMTTFLQLVVIFFHQINKLTGLTDSGSFDFVAKLKTGMRIPEFVSHGQKKKREISLSVLFIYHLYYYYLNLGK